MTTFTPDVYKRIVANEETDLLLAAYTDDAVHDLPTDVYHNFKAFATPIRIVTALQDYCDGDDDAIIAAEIEEFFTPRKHTEHLDHYLLDVNAVHGFHPQEDPDAAATVPYVSAWHKCIGDHAVHCPLLADRLATIATTRTDGQARAAMEALLWPSSPLPQRTASLHDILSQPTVTCDHPTPQDDLTQNIIRDYFPDTMLHHDGLRLDLAQRAVAVDTDGYTSALALVHSCRHNAENHTRTLLDAVKEKERAGAYADLTGLLSAAAREPELLTLDTEWAVLNCRLLPDSFYTQVMHLHREGKSLPAETVPHITAVGAERDFILDHLWSTAHGTPHDAIRGLNDVYAEYTGHDFFLYGTKHFVDHLGADHCIAYCTRKPPIPQLGNSMAHALTAVLASAPQVNDAQVTTIVGWMHERDTDIDPASRDALLAALFQATSDTADPAS